MKVGTLRGDVYFDFGGPISHLVVRSPMEDNAIAAAIRTLTLVIALEGLGIILAITAFHF